MAFDSPITEWWFIVVCENELFLVDIFRDLILRFNEESEHSAFRVVRVLLSGILQLGVGGFTSGVRLLRDRFIEGYDIPESGFSTQVDGVLSAIKDGGEPPVTAEDGFAILDTMVELTQSTEMRVPRDDV
jgi:predicted dehydrogenase